MEIKKIEDDYNLLENAGLDFSSELERQDLLSRIKKLCKKPLNRIAHKEREKAQNHIFENFRKEYGLVGGQNDDIDLCIIGSDEVFNCLNAGYWGFSSQLFGNIPNCRNIITYAASCGATTYDKLPLDMVHRIENAFKNVTAFSVRDSNTYSFVTKITNKTVVEHLDPVLVYDFSEEIEKATLPKLPKKYCIIYSYRNRINDYNEIKLIDDFCKRNKMIPVSIGAPQYWTKLYIPCSPFECLKIFQNASFVFTDTFHGTIFSYKYSNGFAVMKRPSNQNKLSDLVDKLNIQNHVLERLDKSAMDAIYALKNSVKDREELINSEHNKTIKYLAKYCEE